MTFWSGWWWPLATAIIGFVYVGLLFNQWLKRRKPHQLAWSFGFLLYAIAALMEAYSEYTQNWDPTVYRVYIVMAASMVGFLGLGSLYLVTKNHFWANCYLVFNLVCLGIFLWGAFTTPLIMEALKPGIVVGGTALGAGGSFPRVMSLFFNIPGSLLLLGTSAWSVFKFWPKPEFRYRAWANVFIFVGTLVIAGAGSMARAGMTKGLYLGEMIASALLLVGFLMAGTLDKGAKTAIASRRATADGAGAQG